MNLDAHVLAAYFCDARVNVFECVNDILEKTGTGKRIADDDKVVVGLDMLLDRCKAIERQQNMETWLRRRFRFINALTDLPPIPDVPKKPMRHFKKYKKFPWKYENDIKSYERAVRKKEKVLEEREWLKKLGPKDIANELRKFLEIIDLLRNSFVHPQNKENVLGRDQQIYIYRSLNKIYDSSVLSVRDRFGRVEEDVKKLRRQDGKKLKPLGTFKLALCSPAGKDEKSPPEPFSNVFYNFGYVFLCSLFLEKKQAVGLLDHFWEKVTTSGYPEPERKMIKEMISVFGVIVPRRRIKTDVTEASVTIDAIRDLASCPSTLMDMLSNEDREKFRVLSEPTDTTEMAKGGNHYILLKRANRSRFATFLMRFFDFEEKCGVRFAVDLGNYFDNVRLKPGSAFDDGEPRPRRLGRKIIAYGRLKNIESSTKPEYWQKLENAYEQYVDKVNKLKENQQTKMVEEEPFIIPTEPHYHYFDDKIGIRLSRNNSLEGYPEVFGDKDVPGSGLAGLQRRDMEPDFWLSPNLLEQVGFYHFVRGSLPVLGELLKRYQEGMGKLVEQVVVNKDDLSQLQLNGEPGSKERWASVQLWVDNQFNNTLIRKDKSEQKYFSVQLGDLPKVLVKALVGQRMKPVTKGRVIERIDQMIKITERREEQLDYDLRVEKKRGKKGFKPLVYGRIADFITDDLMRFQPADPARLKTDGGKVNSQEYQILQSTLSYYAKHINERPRVYSLFRKAGLIEGEFNHMFLDRMGLQNRRDKYASLIDFYYAYLDERKCYLEEQKMMLMEQEGFDEDDLATKEDLAWWLRLRAPSSLENWLAENPLEYDLKKKPFLKKPLFVPNRFLYEPILSMVLQQVADVKKESPKELLDSWMRGSFEEKGKTFKVRPSFSWLVLQYFKTCCDDSPQKMYGYGRWHKLFKNCFPPEEIKDYEKDGKWFGPYPSTRERREYIKQIKTKIKNTEGKEEKEKIKKISRDYKRRERKINLQKTQDIVQFLLARQYLGKIFTEEGESAKVRLKSINTDFLDKNVKHKLPVPGTNRKRWVSNPEIKLKNVGSIAALARDRRIGSLLQYYPEDKIEFLQSDIKTELASYRRARFEVFRMVGELEGLIMNCASLTELGKKLIQVDHGVVPKEKECIFGPGRHGDFLFILYSLLNDQKESPAGKAARAKGSLEIDRFEKARWLRNGFSHSEFPRADIFTDIHGGVGVGKGSQPLADRFQKELERLYAPWVEFLQAVK